MMIYPRWSDLSEADRAASEVTTFGMQPPAYATPPRVHIKKAERPDHSMRRATPAIRGKRVA